MALGMSVGEIAARSGVAVSALHFYESKGLIHAHRTPGNQRRYDRDVLRRLGIIRVGQELGIPLVEIATALADLPRDHTPSRADWSVIASAWGKALDRRIERLQSLREGLDSCIGCGCLSLDHCPLRNPHDRLGAEGSGPRLLLDPDDGDSP